MPHVLPRALLKPLGRSGGRSEGRASITPYPQALWPSITHAVTEHPDHADQDHYEQAILDPFSALLEPLGAFVLNDEFKPWIGVVRMGGCILPIESDLRIWRQSAWSSEIGILPLRPQPLCFIGG